MIARILQAEASSRANCRRNCSKRTVVASRAGNTNFLIFFVGISTCGARNLSCGTCWAVITFGALVGIIPWIDCAFDNTVGVGCRFDRTVEAFIALSSDLSKTSSLAIVTSRASCARTCRCQRFGVRKSTGRTGVWVRRCGKAVRTWRTFTPATRNLVERCGLVRFGG